MNKRPTYIIGIVFCCILAIITICLFAVTSGKDSETFKIIYVCFALWMVFGIYRGFRHLFGKQHKRLYPTFQGVAYNILPVSNLKVIKDFFNPLEMKFRTMGSVCIICILWTCMVYISPRFAVYFWIALALMVILKGWLLSKYVKLNNAQNALGEIIMEQTGEIVICQYDVTRQLIESPDSTAEEVIDPIAPYVNIMGSYEDYRTDLSQFTIAQRHILSVNWYITEVYSDGHYEFFTGPYGIAYLDAIEGLKAIGAEKYATILEAAVSDFDGINHPEYDLKRRTESIDRLNLDFEDADDALYSLDEYGEDIQALQMAYIQSHVNDFLFDNPLRS